MAPSKGTGAALRHPGGSAPCRGGFPPRRSPWVAGLGGLRDAGGGPGGGRGTGEGAGEVLGGWKTDLDEVNTRVCVFRGTFFVWFLRETKRKANI